MKNIKVEQLTQNELLTINGGGTPEVDFSWGVKIGKIIAKFLLGLFS